MELKSELDQHFMIDRNLIKKIIGYADLKKKDIVLEIGPGLGFLTKELCKKCKVIAVERDENFKEKLDKLAKISKPNLEIVYGNVLELMKKLKFNKVVSNIPYSIVEPLFRQFFRYQPDLIVLTVPENFVQKLVEQKTKLGLIAPLFFKTEVLEGVTKKAFTPRPKTKSAIIMLTPREEESLSVVDIILRKFVLFNHMKTKNALRESLVYGLKLTKNKARNIIEALSLDSAMFDKNSDLLSFEEFKKLKNSLMIELS